MTNPLPNSEPSNTLPTLRTPLLLMDLPTSNPFLQPHLRLQFSPNNPSLYLSSPNLRPRILHQSKPTLPLPSNNLVCPSLNNSHIPASQPPLASPGSPLQLQASEAFQPSNPLLPSALPRLL